MFTFECWCRCRDFQMRFTILLKYEERWLCSVQSCLFVKFWPEIFLVQCRENLCNVGAAFAATGYYQNINRFKIKIAKKWCYSYDIALGFFLGNTAQGFCLCNVVPRVLQNYWTGCFHVRAMLSGASWTTLHKVFTCAMLSKEYYNIIEQDFSRAMLSGASWTTWHKVFSVTFCNVVLRKLRQHWNRFFFCNVVCNLKDNITGFSCGILPQKY